NLTIDGPGATQLTVLGSSSPAFRVFEIAQVTVTIQGLTISGGEDYGTGGAGILSNNAVLMLRDCVVSGNRGVIGGGIYNNGSSLSIVNCTVSDNLASDTGGGIFTVCCDTSITDSTISGNTAQSVGGGIGNYFTPVTISNSTISGN